MIEPGRDPLLEKLSGLRFWQRGDQRAPHKPLLLLVALGRVSRGEPRMAEYNQFADPLRRLLSEFGPPREPRPEYPFYRLVNDGLWDLEMPGEGVVREALKENPTDYMLKSRQVSGGFPEEIQSALESDPGLLRRAAEFILEKHFADTLHDEILSEVGLDLGRELVLRTRRDPAFRRRVLLAYEFRCALCGFDLQMNHAPIGLDAAHIRWKQADGPDAESNGLALCTLHHRLFDRGAFTVNEERRALVSHLVVGSALQPWLMAYHGKEVRRPQEEFQNPAPEHLDWHGREVFRSPARG